MDKLYILDMNQLYVQDVCTSFCIYYASFMKYLYVLVVCIYQLYVLVKCTSFIYILVVCTSF